MSSSSPMPEAAGSVGLGYGIAIAVGILVLISTIMLVSYACVRATGGARNPQRVSSTSDVIPSTTTASRPGPEQEVVLVVGGLDAPTIESYPKFLFPGSGRAAGSGSQGSGIMCSICLGEYSNGEVLRRMPDCKHCFHATCVDEWLRMSATCPMCRQSPEPSPIATPLSQSVPLAAHAR